MYFTLKDQKSLDKTLIYIRYYCKNSKSYFKISTKLFINPKDWNFVSRMPITKRGLASVESRQLTHQLNKLDELLQSTINKHGASLTKEHLTKAFRPKKNTSENVVDLYSEFLKEKKQQGTVTARTLQKYNVVFLKYKTYCDKQSKSHKITELDDDFYVGFLAYLRHKDKLNDNTLARYLTFFKTFVIWCNRKGFDVNNDYTNVSVKKYQSDDVALNSKEVEILENADLNGADEKARDLFLIGVYSGQRFSDYSVFERADIQGDFIIKRSEKTENHSIIPLHDKLKNLLDKYNWRLPKISSQKFNVRMQSVCKDLGFDNEIKKTTYRGSQKTIELLPLWKMVASHTARRTYITLMAEKGMADHFIMAVTGIKDVKTLIKYKKLNKNNLFTISESLWG
mgnify:FL=1